jgi:hypothetical protein
LLSSRLGYGITWIVAGSLSPNAFLATTDTVYSNPFFTTSVHEVVGAVAVQVRSLDPVAVAVTRYDVAGAAPDPAPGDHDTTALVPPGTAVRSVGVAGAPLTSSVRVNVIDAPVASMTTNDTVAVPSPTGTPEMTPSSLSDSPRGSPVAR